VGELYALHLSELVQEAGSLAELDAMHARIDGWLDAAGAWDGTGHPTRTALECRELPGRP